MYHKPLENSFMENLYLIKAFVLIVCSTLQVMLTGILNVLLFSVYPERCYLVILKTHFGAQTFILFILIFLIYSVNSGFRYSGVLIMNVLSPIGYLQIDFFNVNIKLKLVYVKNSS